MKRTVLIRSFGVFALLVVICLCMGVGPYSSGAAATDLREQMEEIHGPEYTGKPVEAGTEDMRFEILSKTWFATNWNLRNALGLDYKYECRVIFTTHTDSGETVRTVTYTAIDPMGHENTETRAYLDLATKREQ